MLQNLLLRPGIWCLLQNSTSYDGAVVPKGSSALSVKAATRDSRVFLLGLRRVPKDKLGAPVLLKCSCAALYLVLRQSETPPRRVRTLQ